MKEYKIKKYEFYAMCTSNQCVKEYLIQKDDFKELDDKKVELHGIRGKSLSKIVELKDIRQKLKRIYSLSMCRNGVVKDVHKDTFYCPDCGFALYWERNEKKD